MVESYLFDLDPFGRAMSLRRGVMGRMLGRERREKVKSNFYVMATERRSSNWQIV